MFINEIQLLVPHLNPYESQMLQLKYTACSKQYPWTTRWKLLAHLENCIICSDLQQLPTTSQKGSKVTKVAEVGIEQLKNYRFTSKTCQAFQHRDFQAVSSKRFFAQRKEVQEQKSQVTNEEKETPWNIFFFFLEEQNIRPT